MVLLFTSTNSTADTSEKDRVCENHGVGNVLFNDALNTFYLRLYGVGNHGVILKKVNTAIITWEIPFFF